MVTLLYDNFLIAGELDTIIPPNGTATNNVQVGKSCGIPVENSKIVCESFVGFFMPYVYSDLMCKGAFIHPGAIQRAHI
jgi:hypothetical protein